MALPSDYRWILVGKLTIRNKKNSPFNAPSFSLTDLEKAISGRIDQEQNKRVFSNNRCTMWCENHHIGDDFYKLILEIADQDTTGVSFYDFSTSRTRDITKYKDEGSHYASHILIMKTPDKYGKHLILVEKVPGIFLSSVESHLTWVCNDDNYTKSVVDDGGKNKKYRCFFDIIGYESKTIREALRTGTLQDIEFVELKKNYEDGIDEVPNVKEIFREMRWDIKKHLSEKVAESFFKLIPSKLKELKYKVDDTQLFIRIKTASGQVKRTEAKVHVNGEDILENTFVQNEKVTDFEKDLPQRYDNFNREMVQKMIEIAKDIDN